MGTPGLRGEMGLCGKQGSAESRENGSRLVTRVRRTGLELLIEEQEDKRKNDDSGLL